MDRNPYNQVNKGGRSVALRKESVDRNVLVVPAGCWLPGRSPQGERG